MNQYNDSEAVLKYHGKTFYFAQRFLGRTNGQAVARLYRFCRFIDDLADESSDTVKAAENLNSIRLQLLEKNGHDPITRDFLKLAEEWQIDLNCAVDLIDGVIMDLGKVAISNQAELIQYCYRVAGTVGLMMCPLLQADSAGERFALDLGIGMQLTNIARDVLFDAKMGRRYLPADWVDGLSADEIAQQRKSDRPKVQQAIRRILQLADDYYASGRDGYRYLPMRSRVSIAIAGRTYRQIGIKLLNNGCDYWNGRIYTTLTEKALLASGELSRTIVALPRPKKVVHQEKLHDDLEFLYP